EAIAAFGKAIKVAPDHDAYHYNLGLVFTIQNRYLEAIECFQRVLTLNPEYNLAHGALAGCYRRLGREEEAVRHIAIATPLMEDESEYNRACFNAICGNVDQAISLLRVALQSQGVTLEWVQSDPDLETIRQDPRYQELLDEYPPAAGAV
ncbi:MAG: tetratricopeptide repeat protein, partial [Chloroflexi bacterium]|nr:tetratricopeptide repeat protein [Chloroflexota bacterium]